MVHLLLKLYHIFNKNTIIFPKIPVFLPHSIAPQQNLPYNKNG